MVFKTAFAFLGKIFGFKKGALALMSAATSTSIIYYLDTILHGTETKRLALPIFAHIFGFGFFFLFVLLDLFTGLHAAKYLNTISPRPQKNFIKSYKLYRTLWKVLGVLLLNTMITTLCLFTEIIDGEYSYYFTLWALVTVWLMASGFEFHSIGENIEKRSGNKPEIFGFYDKVLEVVQRKAIAKVEQAFDVLETEPKEKEPAAQPAGEVEQVNELNENNLENEKTN